MDIISAMLNTNLLVQLFTSVAFLIRLKAPAVPFSVELFFSFQNLAIYQSPQNNKMRLSLEWMVTLMFSLPTHRMPQRKQLYYIRKRGCILRANSLGASSVSHQEFISERLQLWFPHLWQAAVIELNWLDRLKHLCNIRMFLHKWSIL